MAPITRKFEHFLDTYRRPDGRRWGGQDLDGPTVTKIGLNTFEFDELWHFYRWRNDEGREKTVMPEHTKHWDDVKAEANDVSGDGIPVLIRERPVFALLFSIDYPHRANASLLRWLNVGVKVAVYGV